MFHHGNPVMAITSLESSADYDLPKDLPSALAPSCAHVSLMLYKTLSAAVYGIDANIIEVEVDVSGVKTDQDYFLAVGLPAAAVRESRDRVRAALKNCGYDIPEMLSDFRHNTRRSQGFPVSPPNPSERLRRRCEPKVTGE